MIYYDLNNEGFRRYNIIYTQGQLLNPNKSDRNVHNPW